jgi:hypothetical protein
VDCSADGLAKRDVRPVFEGDRITLQSLFMCQQVFSASLIGRVEARIADEKAKNDLCQVVPHPNTPKDFLLASLVSNQNVERWLRAFPVWLLRSRLSLLSQDGLFRFVLGSLRAGKILAASTANMSKIFQQEFPDAENPGA